MTKWVPQDESRKPRAGHIIEMEPADNHIARGAVIGRPVFPVLLKGACAFVKDFHRVSG